MYCFLIELRPLYFRERELFWANRVTIWSQVYVRRRWWWTWWRVSLQTGTQSIVDSVIVFCLYWWDAGADVILNRHDLVLCCTSLINNTASLSVNMISNWTLSLFSLWYDLTDPHHTNTPHVRAAFRKTKCKVFSLAALSFWQLVMSVSFLPELQRATAFRVASAATCQLFWKITFPAYPAGMVWMGKKRTDCRFVNLGAFLVPRLPWAVILTGAAHNVKVSKGQTASLPCLPINCSKSRQWHDLAWPTAMKSTWCSQS